MKIAFTSILLTAFLSIVSITTMADTAVAQQGQGTTTKDIVCRRVSEDCRAPTTSWTIEHFTGVVTNVLTAIIASVSVLVLVIAGFMYITSAGNPDTVKKAKNAIIYALVGIVVAFFAQAIVRFILSSV